MFKETQTESIRHAIRIETFNERHAMRNGNMKKLRATRGKLALLRNVLAQCEAAELIAI